MDKFPPEQFGAHYPLYGQAREIVALGFARTNNVPKASHKAAAIDELTAMIGLAGKS